MILRVRRFTRSAPHRSRRALPGIVAVLTAWLAIGCSDASDLPPEPETQTVESETPPAPKPPKVELEPVPEPVPGQSANLLQQYVGRDPIEPTEPGSWALPFQSKRAVVALLISAAQARKQDLPLVLSDDARWGLPDTRELGARPVFADDDGHAFLAALRTAAARFPAGARWEMQPLMPGIQAHVRTGAEPMWSWYTNGPDRIVFRQIIRGGRAVIDYVGFFEQLPNRPVIVRGHGAPPPVAPPLRLPDGRVVKAVPRSASPKAAARRRPPTR